MIKKWLYRTTPFVIIAVLVTFGIMYELIAERGGPERWKYPLIVRLFYLLIAIIAIDLLLKFSITIKTYWIWMIEMFLCLGLVYYWIVT